jgi:hypothetical protein
MGVAPNQSYMVGLPSLIWYGQKTGGPLIKPILRLVFYAEHRRPTLKGAYKPVFYAEHRRPTPYSLEYGVAKGLQGGW